MPIFYAKVKDMSLRPSNTREWLDYLVNAEGKEVVININRTTGVRTSKQNDSLHRWFELVAKALNESGKSVQIILKHKLDIDWTSDLVKELLWRTAQLAITGKKSTTRLDKTSEIDVIFEHLNRHLGEKFGIHVPFPSEQK